MLVSLNSLFREQINLELKGNINIQNRFEW